jgi:general nucleoside transport system permease protein
MDSGLFQNVLEGIFSAAFLASILRVTTPILFPSLGALISDRAGVINIGLEGTMLIAAFTGVVFSAYAQDWWGTETGEAVGPWLGLAMGVLMGVLTALMLGFFALKLKANLILSGIAINFLGQAATVAVMYELTGSRGDTKGALDSLRMPFIQLPEQMQDVPVLSFFFDVFDNQSIMTWLAFISMFAVWYFMYRTPTGIHLRAVGENPEAAASVGIRVTRIQYLALALSGVLSALGGIHLSMGYLTFFQNNMSSGRGFIALATPYLGGGHPIGTGLASIIFGFFDALSVRVGSLEIPSQLPALLPFIATVMALVIYALQGQLTVRVRTLRAAEGEGFDAAFWKAIQRISVLHMFMAMLAVGGLIITISMASAPKGFRSLGTDWENSDVFRYALGIGAVSLALIGINLPFMLDVERIGRRTIFSAAAAGASLWLYLGMLLLLAFRTNDTLRDNADTLGLAAGLVLGLALWLALGGYYLLFGGHKSGTSQGPAEGYAV